MAPDHPVAPPVGVACTLDPGTDLHRRVAVAVDTLNIVGIVGGRVAAGTAGVTS